MMMRMVADGLLNHVASLGAPGVDEGRWMVPVRPGDTVTCRYTVLEKRDLASRPDVGISKVLVELLNQKGEVAANWRTNQLVRRRHPGPRAGRRRAEEAARAHRQPVGGARHRQPDARRPLLRGPPDRRADRPRHAHLRQGRDHRLCPRVRSAALPPRRGGGEGLAVRRLVRLGLAHGGLLPSAATSARGSPATRLRAPRASASRPTGRRRDSEI